MNTNNNQSTNPSSDRSLFVSVETFDNDNKSIGSRVVDMYHYGTRNWLQNHTWWAMHNSCVVETRPATEEEAKAYVEAATASLVNKYNKVA
jgi:hypothetical protein